jgi:hypothetical protein
MRTASGLRLHVSNSHGGRSLLGKEGDRMKHQGGTKIQGRGKRWTSMAIAGAAMLAAALCGGCLYTIVPAMAGPSTTYPQSAGGQSAQTSQPSQPSQPSDGQTNQNGQNKQQTGMPPNGAQSQGQGGTP